MLLKVHPENPSDKHIRRIKEILESGGVISYPTDSVYAFGCLFDNARAVEKMVRLKGEKKKKTDFSFVFKDISQLAEYTTPMSRPVFKLLKSHLPGPFTFLLEANNRLPKITGSKKKVIGARIPDNPIVMNILQAIDKPLATTSIHDDDEILEYTTDAELIHDRWGKLLDAVIDGGVGDLQATTVVDCTTEPWEVVREGKGIL